MCSRFTQSYTWPEVCAFLNLSGEPQNLKPRYNIAPSQDVAVVRAEQQQHRLSMLRWGLLPAWTKDVKMGARLINARCETAHVKPSFRAAFKARRCLVPVDGFYEWKRVDGIRQPYRIHMRDGGLFAFAGLWEPWRVPEGLTLAGRLAGKRPGDMIESFTILTTAANETLTPIHVRMPVILAPDAFDAWLAGEVVPLGPYSSKRLTAYPVSTHVNSPRNDDARCVEPVTAPDATT